MEIVNLNLLHAHTLISQLVEYGAQRVVISPGSRSTPLAIVAASHPALQTCVITDERAAGFFALGLAKADHLPAILICTSGTAAANYFPAVIEASEWGVPLIVLTADRPPRLRYTGAPQTIDQIELYGRHVRFFAELPEVRGELADFRKVRSIAAAAYSHSMSSPCGPVHLNIPLDEPLAPIVQNTELISQLQREIERETSPQLHLKIPAVEQSDIENTARTLRESLCGLVVAGPGAAQTHDEAESIFTLARTLGWPVFADIVSGLRGHGEPCAGYYDIYLRDEQYGNLAPDCVLHFGGFPTSKVLANYLSRHSTANPIWITPHARAGDPLGRNTEFLCGGSGDFCSALIPKIGPARDSLLYDPFTRASQLVRQTVMSEMEKPDPACEAAHVYHALSAMIPDFNIVLASSLPIRYADSFCFPENLRTSIYSMRGANGIDGTISHAAGIAAATEKPTLLVTGDLAFLHDLNALSFVNRYAKNLSILLLDNNGGGIFSYLPVYDHEHPDLFETIHGTPHHLTLRHAAELFDMDWHFAGGPQRIAAAMNKPGSRPKIICIRASREQNHQAHLALLARLTGASHP